MKIVLSLCVTDENNKILAGGDVTRYPHHAKTFVYTKKCRTSEQQKSLPKLLISAFVILKTRGDKLSLKCVHKLSGFRVTSYFGVF